MNLKQIPLYFRTVRHLKPLQIYHRAARRLLGPVFHPPRSYKRQYYDRIPEFMLLANPPQRKGTAQWGPGFWNFCFLNISQDIAGDWLPPQASRLWVFHLHSFEYLLSEQDPERIEKLADDWMRKVEPRHADTWHPFVVSNRICNWFWTCGRFESTFSPVFKLKLANSLRNQLEYLYDNLEFDVLGNHLVRDCKALILGGLFFNTPSFVDRGLKVLRQELGEQILPDGGHYERSPMYHCHVLEDLWIIYANLELLRPADAECLAPSICSMASFLSKLVWHGRLPLLNDTVQDQEYNPEHLLSSIAEKIPLPREIPGRWHSLMPHTGLYVYNSDRMRLVFDVGKIGPDFLCAHSHSDTLSFLLNLDGQEIVTDSGVYEYASGKWRTYFRSAQAHNVLRIAGMEPNEIWGSFRVGRRGYPFGLMASKDGRVVQCGFNGYARLAVNIFRTVLLLEDDEGVAVCDHIGNKGRTTGFESLLHFGKNVKVLAADKENHFYFTAGSVAGTVAIRGAGARAQLEESWASDSFGEKYLRPMLRITGNAEKGTSILTTVIVAGQKQHEQTGVVLDGVRRRVLKSELEAIPHE